MANAVTLIFWLDNVDARNLWGSVILEMEGGGGGGGVFLKWGGLNSSTNYVVNWTQKTH